VLKCPINMITNRNPACSHAIMWQYQKLFGTWSWSIFITQKHIMFWISLRSEIVTFKRNNVSEHCVVCVNRRGYVTYPISCQFMGANYRVFHQSVIKKPREIWSGNIVHYYYYTNSVCNHIKKTTYNSVTFDCPVCVICKIIIRNILLVLTMSEAL
jgi:hypothetical protein